MIGYNYHSLEVQQEHQTWKWKQHAYAKFRQLARNFPVYME